MEHNCGVRLPLQTEFLECVQSKVLHTIIDARWYVLNTVIRRDLQTPTFKEEICHYNLIAQPDNR
jgi:hypothetical protein